MFFRRMMETAAANKDASDPLLVACLAASVGKSASCLARHGGWFGGDRYASLFVLGLRWLGDASSVVVVKTWSRFWSVLLVVVFLL